MVCNIHTFFAMQEFQLRCVSRRRERQHNKLFWVKASISLTDPDVLKCFKGNRNWDYNWTQRWFIVTHICFRSGAGVLSGDVAVKNVSIIRPKLYLSFIHKSIPHWNSARSVQPNIQKSPSKLSFSPLKVGSVWVVDIRNRHLLRKLARKSQRLNLMGRLSLWK